VARQRFFREARAAAAVRDEHVVTIHEVSAEGGPAPYLVMEFIAGKTLESRIREKGALAAKEVLRIGMQAARGLAAAHRQGLIHRDVKPANILLENGVERVKITDFGLARATDDGGLTQAGVIAGTPLFMSPEQARGEALDGRSDLFSLGSVLYALCTGEQAFRGGNTPAILRRVCEDRPRPIREVNPDIPPEVAAVVERLLAKEAGQRFQSAAELAEVLCQLLARLPQPPAAPPAEPKADQISPAVRSRKRLAVAAVLLLVGVIVGVVAVAVRWPSWSSPPPGKPPDPDPRVLTVSQRPEDGGRFRTIKEALEAVEPGMTIRVLDDAVYPEFLEIKHAEQYRGVTLEAAGKASLRRLPTNPNAVLIRGVPGFTLRDFRFERDEDEKPHSLVWITGPCAGVVLDRLDIPMAGHACVHLFDVPLSGNDAPIVIQNCTLRGKVSGVSLEGREYENRDRPRPCSHVVIRNNTLAGSYKGVEIYGMIHKVHVVGNRIVDSESAAIDLVDLLPGSADILVANNTMLGCEAGVSIWDDHSKGKNFLESKNIRVQNNLVFRTSFDADMVFSNHRREEDGLRAINPCDLKALLNSPEWRFGHNWREIDPQRGKRQAERWIPLSPTDHRQIPIEVLSRQLGDPHYLQPAKDSPLARGGAGESDASLPAYVGAVAPEGVPPWDWDRTWDMQCRRLITVSKEPAGGGHFRTIKEALEAVKPEMTIRVLDDAIYPEHLLVNRPELHRGVTLEAAGKASLRRVPPNSQAVWIQDVPDFTLRGFHFERVQDQIPHCQVYIAGRCPGVVLDGLDMEPDCDCMDLYGVPLSGKDAPIVIQNCTLRGGPHGVKIEGRARDNIDHPLPCDHVVIRTNTVAGCDVAVALTGAIHKVHVVGNRIVDSRYPAIELVDLLPGSAEILVANNTMLGCNAGVWIWHDHSKGKDFLQCKSIRVQNNLVFRTELDADILFSNHRREDPSRPINADLKGLLNSPEWRFGYNWREIDPQRGARQAERWIPPGPTDHLLDSIEVLSRKLGDPQFLRPPKGSPLASSGAGGERFSPLRVASAVGQAAGLADAWRAGWVVAQTRGRPDPALPAYVGAVPPEGVEPWDWDTTWKALAGQDAAK
jgi:hypothetical protein